MRYALLTAARQAGFGFTLLVVLLLTSCASDGDSNWNVVVSFTSIQSTEMRALRAELEDAASRDARVHLEIVDHHGNFEGQRHSLRSNENLGDLLVLVPARHGIFDREIRRLHMDEHPVVVVGQDIGHDDFAVALIPDDLVIGRAAGRWARRQLPEGGNIVALKGNMSVRQIQDRQRGFLQGLAEELNADVERPKLVYESETDSTRAGAARAMRDALIAHDKIDLVFAHSDEIAFGAYESAVNAQREAEVVMIGIGGMPEAGLRWLEEGVLNATLRSPFGGSEAINYATRILSSEKLEHERIRLPTRLYTMETLTVGGTPVR